MNKENTLINNIPAILWGEKRSKLFLAVHGNMSSKSDVPISILAEKAIPLGYQVLSFDLPEHGDRKKEPTLCKVQNCVEDLKKIMEFAKKHWDSISIMATSIGVYFSLLAYKKEKLEQSLFLSPLVDMNSMIKNMMKSFDITEERLFREKEIVTPIGQVLYWDYYQYVKNNPITDWNHPTAILYGKRDTICEYSAVSSFATQFNCNLEISEHSEHYFHTNNDYEIYKNWLSKHI